MAYCQIVITLSVKDLYEVTEIFPYEKFIFKRDHYIVGISLYKESDCRNQFTINILLEFRKNTYQCQAVPNKIFGHVACVFKKKPETWKLTIKEEIPIYGTWPGHQSSLDQPHLIWICNKIGRSIIIEFSNEEKRIRVNVYSVYIMPRIVSCPTEILK